MARFSCNSSFMMSWSAKPSQWVSVYCVWLRRERKASYLNPTQGGKNHQEGLLPRITPFSSLSAPEVKALSSLVELWGKSLRETALKGSKLCLENCVVTSGTKTAIRQVKKFHHLDWNLLHDAKHLVKSINAVKQVVCHLQGKAAWGDGLDFPPNRRPKDIASILSHFQVFHEYGNKQLN